MFYFKCFIFRHFLTHFRQTLWTLLKCTTRKFVPTNTNSTETTSVKMIDLLHPHCQGFTDTLLTKKLHKFNQALYIEVQVHFTPYKVIMNSNFGASSYLNILCYMLKITIGCCKKFWKLKTFKRFCFYTLLCPKLKS